MKLNISAVLRHAPRAKHHPFVTQSEHRPALIETVSFDLVCATANVLTLYQNRAEHGRGITARLEALLKAFDHEGIMVVGVQETRSQMQGHTTCLEYHVLASPATAKGVGGVQLWVRRKWKTHKGIIHISHADLRILHADPQFMVVKLAHDDLRLIFLVGHAPNCPTFDAATTYWNRLSHAIPPALRSWPLIGFIDANARVGSIVSEVIGPFGQEDENLPGECFHQWLHDQSLFLPQTFEAHHHGDHDTWTHSSGATARLDYIAVDQVLRQEGISSRIASVDLTLHHADHCSVQAAIPIQCRIAKHDQKAPPTVAQVHAPPCIAWHNDVHTHAAALQQWMQASQPLRAKAYCRKHHLQESTWTMIQAKRFHWNRLRQLRRTLRHGILRELFQSWKNKQVHDTVASLRPWLCLTDRAIALHSWQYQRLCSTVTAAVRLDDQQFYAALADEQGAVAADEGLSGLWRKIKHLLPKSIAKKKANIRCTGPQIDDLTDHYSQLEAGREIAYEDLLQQCAQRQLAAQDDLPLRIQLADLPTRVEVEQICKLAKRRKAPGLDGVQAEHLQALMSAHSEVFFSLLFKMWTVSAEPVQFKGGYICSIAKKHGALTAAGMRGIMLLDVLGKLHHSLMRRKLLPWASQNRMETQFGGFKGQQTVFASLLLRSYVKVTEAKKVSLAIIFVDVRNAFHCMLRQHAFATIMHLPAKLQQILTAEGLDVEQLTNDIAAHAQAFDSAPSTVARLIKDAHCDTWFTCPGSDKCFETARGSRPGSPIADLAYNIMTSALMKELQKALHQFPLIQSANLFMECLSPTIAWVDDIALPLPCLQAKEMDGLISEVMQRVHQIFRGYGLRLNCASGKTEAIVHYRGHGAPACRKAQVIESFSRLSVPGHESLHVVTQYTHLGIVVAQTCDLRQDLKIKLGKASAAYRSMSKSIFLNRRLAIPIRLKLLDALVLPIVFYGSGSWPLLNARQFQHLSAVITKWQRQIAGDGFWKSQTITDAEFRAKWRIPPLAVRLAKHRLLFLLQLHRHGPRVVWDVITAEDALCQSTWFDALRHALQWMGTMIPDFPAQEWTCEEILQWTQNAHAQMPNTIRRAVARYLTQEQTIHHVAFMHRSIKQICQQFGVCFDEPPDASNDGSLTGVFVCATCSKCFSTIQGLTAHRWKQHGHISEERRFVYNGVCEGCRKCFWTAQRLQQHLRYSRRKPNGCFWWVSQHLDPLDQPETVAMPSLFQGQHRLPCTAAAGPDPQTVSTRWSRQHQIDWQIWQDEWKQHGFPEELSSSLCDAVHDALSDATLQWCTDPTCDLTWTWCEIVEEYHHDDAQHSQAIWAFALWGRVSMYDVIDQIDDVDHKIHVEEQYLQLIYEMPVAGLLDRLERLHRARPPEPSISTPLTSACDHRQPQPSEPLHSAFDQSAHLLGPINNPEVCSWPNQTGVPICELPDGRRVLILLHLFSGRRREGDCHDWATRLVSQYLPGFDIMMLSIDTAVGGAHCDLLSGPGLDSLLRIVQTGIVTGTLSGPPCETWSAARHLPPPSQGIGRWPRPLRSSERAWGLAFLTHRELHQLATGSALMLSNIKIELMVVLNGGAAMLEHPDLPEDPAYASVWRTPLQSRICGAAPGHQRLHVKQWKYGASAVKPTLIRVMGLPRSATTLHAQAIPGLQKPTNILAGRDEQTGQFRTACAKEYPSGFCRALVVTLFTGLARRMKSEGTIIRNLSLLEERDKQWLDCVATLSTTSFSSKFLPDYQPKC